MIKTIMILLLCSGLCYAQNKELKKNEKYSYGDFQGQYFKDSSEFNNTLIVGSCFGVNNQPYSKVFPEDMIGVTFRLCNLANAVIPEGNIIESNCVNSQIKAQNDGEDWVVDKDLKPVEPLKKDRFQALSLSIDPKDIPAEKLEESVTQTAIKAVAIETN